MVKLIDLHPEWINHNGRKGLGVAFDCMVGSHRDGKSCKLRNFVLFTNPLDGGSPWPGDSRDLILEMFPREEDRYWIRGCSRWRWDRKGDTFESLSMTPSVDLHACGHMTLTNGIFG